MSLNSNTRLDYLDAVRGFALILGIIFHASLSFIPVFIGWAVMDVSTSDVVSIFALVSHSFRMELFFLIAGFFAHMKLQNQGAKPFLKSRVVRIAIPFIIGWILLRPLLVSAWVMGAESLQGDVNILPALINGYENLLSGKDILVGTHLWFLYYLLLISSIAVLLRFVVGLAPSLKHHLAELADRAVAWVCRSRWAVFIVAIPTACCLWFMQHWSVDTPDKSLLPNIPVTLLYGGFFMFGYFLHRQSALMASFARLSWGKGILCIVAIIAVVILSVFESKQGHPQFSLFKAGYMYSYAIMMWTLVSLTIGLCKHWFGRANKFVRYIADSSYWLYLFHLPIVIWLQVAVAELPFHWSLKWFGVCVVTLTVSLLLYDLFVRSTFIGAILNGKRRERVVFAS